MKVLILGASGMLGHTLFYELSQHAWLNIYGTVRQAGSIRKYFSTHLASHIIENVDAFQLETIASAISHIEPSVIINCIGVIRQLPEGKDPLTCIEINARLPHLLAMLAKTAGARLIHISTDCVFDGKQGNYLETDPPSAYDTYGISKYLGEVYTPPALTLRTSIIGHELRGHLSLVEWFLAQPGPIKGYTNAIYSGLPTCELSRIISDFVLPRTELHGLYHVSAPPISKHDLLTLIAEEYGHMIHIEKDHNITSNKSLDSRKFQLATGYHPKGWPELVAFMHERQSAFTKGKY